MVGPKLLVGRLGRAVGLKGEIEVLVISDAPERFAVGALVLTDDGTLTVKSSRTHRDRTIVSFEEVDDRSGAEALRGAEVFVEERHARALEDDEYWDHDLVGCVVTTIDGEVLGAVTDVLHGANDVLVVTDGEAERLIPFIADVVRSVEPKQLITIELLPGLLD